MFDDNDDETCNKVGFKSPPVHSRWPKGTSGNPSGKRKNLTILDMPKNVKEVFLKKVTVHDGKKVRRVPKIAALLEKKLNDAFNDQSGRALGQVLKLAREFRIFQLVEKREIDLSNLTPEERELCREAAELAFKKLR